MRFERYFKVFQKNWKMNRKQFTKYYENLEKRTDIPTSELRDLLISYEEEILDVLVTRKHIFKYFLMVPVVLMGYSILKVGFLGFMTLFFASIIVISLISIIYLNNEIKKNS